MTSPSRVTCPSAQKIASALRLSVADPRDYLVALATLLRQCLPGQTDVVCVTDQTFGAPARVTHLSVRTGRARYVLRVDSAGRLCPSLQPWHEPTPVVAELLPLAAWIDALATDLAHSARGSALLRRAVAWLAA